MPGKAAYEPDTQKNVPKYLTPIGTSAILIANPIAHMHSPARMNGYRILILSDHTAKIRSTIANTDCQQNAHFEELDSCYALAQT